VTLEKRTDDSSKFFHALVKAGRVKRWHTVDTVGTQTVADHTYGVLCTLLYITDGTASKDLMLAALQHDIAEGMTGDAPHPFKLKHREEFDYLEDAAMREINPNATYMGTLTSEEKLLLKIADLLEMGIWATYELVLGNAYALTIMQNILKALSGLPVNDRAMGLVKSLEVNILRYAKEKPDDRT
jgi:5'-deoxynucleotidase YfbR-like HD superfamily hydrolase